MDLKGFIEEFGMRRNPGTRFYHTFIGKLMKLINHFREEAILKYVLILLLCLEFLAANVLAAEKVAFKNPEDAVSYSVGYQMGKDFLKYGMAMDPEVIAAGIKDALSETKPRISEEEMRVKLADLQKQMKEKQMKQQKKQATKNLADGEAFLAENANKEGVVTLASGLQYQVLTKGDGPSPKATDTVTVNYRGTSIDGTEFDSSYSRGKPATFKLDRVIKGWTEGLQLMKPGSKWKLFIPAKLAYGNRGAGPRIGPNSALIFEVELISIAENEKQ